MVLWLAVLDSFVRDCIIRELVDSLCRDDINMPLALTNRMAHSTEHYVTT